jgi:cation diffusion facilitator CzcD-associated flavoprotein CzcO
MESYAAYGLEMQQRFVPDLEAQEVVIRTAGKHRFEVTLSDGETLRARNVVSAAGLSGLAFTPEALDGLGEHLTHTSAVHSYSHFAEKIVAIIGAGASATEAGALVHEAGGRAHRWPAAGYRPQHPGGSETASRARSMSAFVPPWSQRKPTAELGKPPSRFQPQTQVLRQPHCQRDDGQRRIGMAAGGKHR